MPLGWRRSQRSGGMIAKNELGYVLTAWDDDVEAMPRTLGRIVFGEASS